MSTASICETCGTQFEPAASPPAACPICEDERQYVPSRGQRWTSAEELGRDHLIRFERESGVITLRIEPEFAIGQRAFLVPHGVRHLMWETLSLVTPGAVAQLEALGGVSAIAISHPHFYAAMVDWSDALGGVPIYLHEADRAWVQRTSPHLRFWRGERLALSDDLVLVRLAGHFPGSTGLWWRSGPTPGGSLFPGDAMQVTMDRCHVTFMYSYPNAIPLNPSAVRAIREAVAPLAYADVFGFRAGRQIVGDAKAAVDRSFRRYLAAVAEPGVVRAEQPLAHDGTAATALPAETIDWIPLRAGVAMRPLHFEEHGYALQLKVEPGTTIGRHRHTGQVHALNVSGYREIVDTGEIVGPGDFVYEPAGNVDTWRCYGDEPCIVHISTTGRVEYLDATDDVAGFSDRGTALTAYLQHCAALGAIPDRRIVGSAGALTSA